MSNRKIITKINFKHSLVTFSVNYSSEQIFRDLFFKKNIMKRTDKLSEVKGHASANSELHSKERRRINNP